MKSWQGEVLKVGEGRLSGYLSAALGVLGFLSVLCFTYPELLTTPEVRAAIDVAMLRPVLLGGLIAAPAFGLLAIFLGGAKRMGWIGIGLAGLAFAMGGHMVPETPNLPVRTFYIGLDYFVLSLFFTAIGFITFEKLFPHNRRQPILRPEIDLDLAYLALNHLTISIILLTVNGLAAGAAGLEVDARLGVTAAQLPIAIQFVLLIALADLTQYWLHRLFHRVPFLWRFHAVHHSIEHMDWIAGSRLHFAEVLVQRSLIVAPFYLFGFAKEAIDHYLIFAGIITVFIHGNLSLPLGWLRYVIATPAFHHWHHAADQAAVDKNFAVHLPVLDLIFGTFLMPGRSWPKRYGIIGDKPPPGLIGQHLYPFGLGARRDPH